MSDDPQTSLTFWLARSILQAQNAPAQEILLDEIEDRVTAGASLHDATGSVIQTKTRAGDFGVEIAGSILAVVVTEGLKAFWGAYFDELRKKLGGKLADLTIDAVKRLFRKDLKGPDGSKVLNQICTSLQVSGQSRGLSPETLKPLMDRVSTSIDLPEDPSGSTNNAAPANSTLSDFGSA